MNVVDDGVGFDISSSRPGRAGGFGLFSIREGLHGLGGRLPVASKSGSGTSATLVALLRQKEFSAREGSK